MVFDRDFIGKPLREVVTLMYENVKEEIKEKETHLMFIDQEFIYEKESCEISSYTVEEIRGVIEGGSRGFKLHALANGGHRYVDIDDEGMYLGLMRWGEDKDKVNLYYEGEAEEYLYRFYCAETNNMVVFGYYLCEYDYSEYEDLNDLFEGFTYYEHVKQIKELTYKEPYGEILQRLKQGRNQVVYWLNRIQLDIESEIYLTVSEDIESLIHKKPSQVVDDLFGEAKNPDSSDLLTFEENGILILK